MTCLQRRRDYSAQTASWRVRDIRRQGSHSPEDVERSFHENCWAEVEKVNELEVRMQQAEHLEAE